MDQLIIIVILFPLLRMARESRSDPFTTYHPFIFQLSDSFHVLQILRLGYLSIVFPLVLWSTKSFHSIKRKERNDPSRGKTNPLDATPSLLNSPVSPSSVYRYSNILLLTSRSLFSTPSLHRARRFHSRIFIYALEAIKFLIYPAKNLGQPMIISWR